MYKKDFVYIFINDYYLKDLLNNMLSIIGKISVLDADASKLDNKEIIIIDTDFLMENPLFEYYGVICLCSEKFDYQKISNIKFLHTPFNLEDLKKLFT